jgi:hypothetical protein
MNFYTEGLTAVQLAVLGQLAPFAASRQFYLAGGTALAIYLGHRRSVDLDWFTSERIPDAMALAQALRETGIDFETGQVAPGTLHGQVQGVRISYLEFHYPLLSPLTHWPEMGANLASLDDLACMKLSAIAQRSSKKDFYDVYALCIQHRPLDQMLALYQRKFSAVDIGPVLYGLVYFDEADEERDPVLLSQVRWMEVKQAFRNWVKALS